MRVSYRVSKYLSNRCGINTGTSSTHYSLPPNKIPPKMWVDERRVKILVLDKMNDVGQCFC